MFFAILRIDHRRTGGSFFEKWNELENKHYENQVGDVDVEGTNFKNDPLPQIAQLEGVTFIIGY